MANSDADFIELILRYLKILKRWIWLIIGITGVATISAIIFAVVSVKLPPDKSPMPNQYTAEAILFVLPNGQGGLTDSILGALGIDQRSGAPSTFNNGDLILEILRSRTILDRLIAEFHLAEKFGHTDGTKGALREILLSSLHITYARNTGSMRLSFVDTNPVFAKDIVNRTVELLDEWFVLNRGIARQKSKEILEEKLREVKNDIATLQDKQKNLQKRYGVLNAQELGVSQATSLANLRSQLIMKEIEIKNYSIYSKVNDPHLEQLNEELRNLRELINQNQTSLPDMSQNTGRPRSLADVAQEFSQLATELDIQQRIYNTLSPQYEAAKLAPESEPIFQVFEKAETPDEKSGPKRSQLVMKIFAGSFCFSIALALALSKLSEIRLSYSAKIASGEKKRT